MEELLHRLEKRIQLLVEQHDRLKYTNIELHQGGVILCVKEMPCWHVKKSHLAMKHWYPN